MTDAGQKIIAGLSEAVSRATALGTCSMTDHHDEAEAYRNRAERAEQEVAELREKMRENAFQSFADEQQWLDMQAKIDALQQHASAMADSMLAAKAANLMLPEHWKAMDTALANWTAWLIDGRE